ncbi:hypothetical protein F4810DRAFT_656673 [Camillea tinctor]|nr:hypothetical protein F4810DRAFT_656673 [Camillea tinctor]
MAELSQNGAVRRLLRGMRMGRRTVGNGEAARYLRDRHFELSLWEENYVLKYGVLLRNEEAESPSSSCNKKNKNRNRNPKNVAWADGGRRKKNRGNGEPMPFFILTLAGRALFLLLLFAMVIAVLTYYILARGSEHQLGLTDKPIGMRFLFAGAGVVVTFMWSSFFYAVAFLSPYRLLRKERLYKALAFKLQPPSNPFSGLVFAQSEGVKDIYLGLVSVTAILSEILPLILGNIASNGPAVGSAEIVCSWLSISILIIMIFTVLASFFVRWPHMALDPSTMLGALFYGSEIVLSGPYKDNKLRRARRVAF